MQAEFAARQRAITLRLSGRPVQSICQALGRSTFWFHKWWRRYLQAGAEGLYDLTHATHHVAQRIAPELERAILSIRRRLQAHAAPATRYRLIGASAILAELKTLGIRPLPNPRTIERVLQRNGLTAPRVRLAPPRVAAVPVSATKCQDMPPRRHSAKRKTVTKSKKGAEVRFSLTSPMHATKMTLIFPLTHGARP